MLKLVRIAPSVSYTISVVIVNYKVGSFKQGEGRRRIHACKIILQEKDPNLTIRIVVFILTSINIF